MSTLVRHASGTWMRPGCHTFHDCFIVHEQSVSDIYRVRGNDFTDGDVIDVGANIGDFAYHLREVAAVGNLYCVEPNCELYSCLVANARGGDVTLCAIGGDTREVQLNLPDYATRLENYTFTTTSPGRLVDTVQQYTLSDYVAMKGIKKISLLKLDCEGAEYDIVKDPAMQIVYDTRIECHHHRSGEVAEDLVKQGMKITFHGNGYVFARR